MTTRNSFKEFVVIGAGGNYDKENVILIRYFADAFIKKNFDGKDFCFKLTPNKGLPIEFVSHIKSNYERTKVVGVVPFEDKYYGVKHLSKYCDIVLSSGEKLFDEFVNSKNWHEHTFYISLLGKDGIVYCPKSRFEDSGNVSIGALSELFTGLKIYQILKKSYYDLSPKFDSELYKLIEPVIKCESLKLIVKNENSLENQLIEGVINGSGLKDIVKIMKI